MCPSLSYDVNTSFNKIFKQFKTRYPLYVLVLKIKNVVLAVAAVGLSAVAINQVIASSGEVKERKVIYMKALDYSAQTHKPLLVIGTPKGKHPCGECIGEILEGHGNPLISEYFARAIAEKTGQEDAIKRIIAEKYNMPVEEQV